MDINRAPLITAIIAAAIVAGGVLVLWGKNSPYQDQPYEQKELSEASYDHCMINDDCALVQEEYCKTVRAVAKNSEFEWREKDVKQTETARREKQTCELAPEEHLDIKNFRTVCKQSKCVAEFSGNLAQ